MNKQFSIRNWSLLILLWIAFFLHQADRQIFNVTLPLIRGDVHLSDKEFGLVGAIFFWAYGLCVPFAGILGDIFSKRNIISFFLLIWSLSICLTGFFADQLWLFVTLLGIATGAAQAFYPPVANAMLGDKYVNNRAFALSIHQTACYAGVILSGVLAGYIGEQWGWRISFKLFGVAGVILAPIIYYSTSTETTARKIDKQLLLLSARESLRVLGKPTAVCLIIAFSCFVFVNVGYLTWMPLFMGEKFKLSVTEAGFHSLIYHHIGAFIGVLFGSRLADRLARTDPRKRLIIQTAALLCGIPFIVLMGLSTSEWVVYSSFFLFGVMRGVYDSNHFASMYEVVQPHLRSTATGFMLMFAFLASAFAPLLLAVLKAEVGLSYGFAGLSLFYLLAALSIGVGARFFFHKDYIGNS